MEKWIVERAYNEFCRSRPPLPSEKDVSAFEVKLGSPLKDEVRDYYLNFNGGWFKRPFFDYLDVDGRLMNDELEVMDGIIVGDMDPELSIERNLDTFDNNWPTIVLPSGYSGCGHLLFFSLLPEDYGWVGLHLAWTDTFLRIHESISDFFASLRSSP